MYNNTSGNLKPPECFHKSSVQVEFQLRRITLAVVFKYYSTLRGKWSVLSSWVLGDG